MSKLLIPRAEIWAAHCTGQNSGIKTDGAFLPRNLQSGFLLESIIGNSAFLELQTLVRRGTSPVYSAPRAAAPRCWHNRLASHKSRTGDPCGSSKPRSEGEPVPFTLHWELPRRGASETAEPATRVALWPVELLHWESSPPWATNICLKVWHPLIVWAFAGSCNPEMLAIGHLGSFYVLSSPLSYPIN